MNNAIILLSLMLLTSQEEKQESSTTLNNFNDSILNLNSCTCNANITNDDSKNNIDGFILAFNNHDLGAWGTWFYDNAPEEEVDSANNSILNLEESNSGNFNSLIWVTYVCGDISEMIGDTMIDSTFQLPIDNSSSIDHLRPADKTDDNINIGFPIDKSNKENNFDVYPNPVSTTLNIIDHLYETKEIKILDCNGKVIHFDFPKAENYSIDVSRFSSGIYFLIFETAQGSILKRVIKE